MHAQNAMAMESAANALAAERICTSMNPSQSAGIAMDQGFARPVVEAEARSFASQKFWI
jgi:hypothetical protein